MCRFDTCLGHVKIIWEVRVETDRQPMPRIVWALNAEVREDDDSEDYSFYTDLKVWTEKPTEKDVKYHVAQWTNRFEEAKKLTDAANSI